MILLGLSTILLTVFAVAVIASDRLHSGLESDILRYLTNESNIFRAENDTFSCLALAHQLSISSTKRYDSDNWAKLLISEEEVSIHQKHLCSYAEYMYYLHELRNYYDSNRKFGLHQEKALRIDTISSISPYSTVFNQYIQKGRPFRGSFTGNISNFAFFSYIEHKWDDILRNCSTSDVNLIRLRNCREVSIRLELLFVIISILVF